MGTYGNPATDRWYTPQYITGASIRALGGAQFDLDPCTHPEQTLAHRGITEAEDGLSTDWGNPELVWINPPSGTPRRSPAIEDLLLYSGDRRIKTNAILFWIKMIRGQHSGAFLCYNLNQIAQTQGYAGRLNMTNHPILLLKDRVRYIREDGTRGESPMFASAIVFVGRVEYTDELRSIGNLMVPG